MGYQRSRQTSTVATVEITPAPSVSVNDSRQSLPKGGITLGPSLRTRGTNVAADKENSAIPVAALGTGRRYPSRDRTAGNNGVLLGKEIQDNVTLPDCVPSKGTSGPSKGKRVRKRGLIAKDDAARSKRKCVQIAGTSKGEENRVVAADCSNRSPAHGISEAKQEGPQRGGCSSLAVVGNTLANAVHLPSNSEIESRGTQDLDDREKISVDAGGDQCTGSSVSAMLEIYSKLHLKYKTLKERKFHEVEEYAAEQMKCLAAFVKAQDDLLEHLQNDKKFLRSLVDPGTVSSNLNRSILLEQETSECQRCLLAERAKNLELTNEVVKLQSLLSEATGMIKQDQNINKICECSRSQSFAAKGRNTCSEEKPLAIPSVSEVHIVDLSCAVSPSFSKVCASNSASHHVAVQTEEIQNASDADHLESKGNVEKSDNLLTGCGITGQPPNVNIQAGLGNTNIQLRNHLQKDALKGEITSPGAISMNSLVRMLLQWVIGFTVTISEEGQSCQLSFLHQSSGYTFKLKYLASENNPDEDGELLYHLVSLGTLHKVAPDWMREEIIFSITQVNLFFCRLLQVANGHGRHMVVRG